MTSPQRNPWPSCWACRLLLPGRQSALSAPRFPRVPAGPSPWPPRILHAARRRDRAGCVRPDCGTRYQTRAAPLAPPLRRHSPDAPFRRKSGCWSGSCLISGAGLSSEWRSGHAAARPGMLPRKGRFASRIGHRMPLLVIPYPAFDPVLVHLGPFAVRWYALAYIVGILLGWGYARILIRSGKLWGGKAPLTVTDFDDFVLWVTLGIILGGRIGYVLFYNLPYYTAHPLEVFDLGNGVMLFHGGFLGCVAAVMLFGWKRNVSILSLGDLTCAAAPIGLFLGRLANFINGEVWGRPPDVPWAMVFPSPDAGPLPRHPRQIYEATLEGLVLFTLLYILIRR